MKKIILILAFAVSGHILTAQVKPGSELSTIDSLKHELQKTKNDTLRLVLINQLRYNYWFKNGNFDSALVYSKLLLPLAQKLGYKIDEAYTYDLIGDILKFQHSQNTLETFFKGVKIAEDPESENKVLPRKYLEMMTYWQPDFNSRLAKNKWQPRYFRLAVLSSLYQDLAHAYGKVMPNPQRLFFYFSKAIEILKSQKNEEDLALCYYNIAEYFYSSSQFDSCLVYAAKASALHSKYMASPSLALIGTVYLKKGNLASALPALRQSIQMGLPNFTGAFWLTYLSFAEYLYKTGAIDSSFYYAKEAHKLTTKLNLPEEMQKTSAMLAALYKTSGAKDSALKYFELSSALSESVNNADKKRKLQSQDFEEQLRQQELQDEKAKIKVYALLTGVGTLLIIAFLLLRNNLQQKKTNALLQQKNLEIERTLIELKSTQAQLIQSEKMASLGELTAGIAHEIQNPLNFVNNFSEVNKELLGELRAEIEKGNIHELNAIADDLEVNEEKINHHGKRADAIVKSMLQHSRVTSSKKELTDINALADECLRLSYHGFRAKHKAFKATLQTDFDDTLDKINIIPQEIGRVLVNLYNNAFYVVAEKKKLAPEAYEPTILVRTNRQDDKLQITVRDNGNGIPLKVVDKIFQPFFTTKPTGQGTGLGLSLSYDVIKTHRGDIRVETKDGERADFIILLPFEDVK